MKRALALATWLATARALALVPSDVATLHYARGTCTGEWYYTDTGKPTREWWSRGEVCDATYQECLNARVTDPSGSHAVTACSTDDKLSRGRQARYVP